ncbi:DUF1294 domain-containing protein [Undibacterium parvum]|uniref:DUF1294 domain-containing protein n=2 Tax=Undibacterium TaxID=401469 RepID=A0A6M4A066_9BURK|nr:DUF1294 domain-containing protein [Undibacterium parvum]AZP13512.1 DUF1294 domain-containing protein [Undibacterium parvum]QJQ04523.1 DUF1294 domain-containing protein [Undibacterium piscinae]
MANPVAKPMTNSRTKNTPKASSKPAARGQSKGQSSWLALSVIPLFILLYLLIDLRWPMPHWWALSYLLLSLLCLVVYAIDKAAAKAGRWRTPENTLHLLALSGGWPGALLAQQWLRHKSSKLAFRIVFWITVVLNIALFLLFTTPLLALFNY